jgi:carbamoyl-phosphate synthase large subunit
MTKIYVSSVGGDIAQSIIEIIANHYSDAKIYGTDLHAENAGVELLANFELSPLANSGGYISWLQSYLKENGIDFFIPVNENELAALSKLSDESLEMVLGKTKIIWAGVNCITIFGSKYKTSKYLTEIGVGTPRVFLTPSQIDISDFPVIVKPESGSGSRLLHICYSRAQVEAAIISTPNYVIQKYVGETEREFSAAIFRSESGVTRVIVFQRRLSGGLTTWARVVNEKSYFQMCENLADSVDLVGSINVQFRLDHGFPSVFEVNGRFSSTILMRHLLGFQDLIWSLGDLDSFLDFDSSKIEGAVAYKLHSVHIRGPE